MRAKTYSALSISNFCLFELTEKENQEAYTGKTNIDLLLQTKLTANIIFPSKHRFSFYH